MAYEPILGQNVKRFDEKQPETWNEFFRNASKVFDVSADKVMPFDAAITFGDYSNMVDLGIDTWQPQHQGATFPAGSLDEEGKMLRQEGPFMRGPFQLDELVMARQIDGIRTDRNAARTMAELHGAPHHKLKGALPVHRIGELLDHQPALQPVRLLPEFLAETENAGALAIILDLTDDFHVARELVGCGFMLGMLHDAEFDEVQIGQPEIDLEAAPFEFAARLRAGGMVGGDGHAASPGQVFICRESDAWISPEG